jgi:hypothetical protein
MRFPRAGVSASYLLWPLLLTLRSREVATRTGGRGSVSSEPLVCEHPAARDRGLLLLPVRPRQKPITRRTKAIARLPLARIGLVCMALGLLLVGLLLWLRMPPKTTQATAQTEKSGRIPADTDGHVPIKNKCEPDGNPDWGEEWVGRYGWKSVRDEAGNVEEVRGSIYVNECRMKNLSYTEEERLGVIRHERGHARGWDHGEGTPETNPAFHADYDLDR